MADVSATAANSVRVFLMSSFKAGCEVLLAVGISGVLESIFPVYDENQSAWANLLEGTLEVIAYLLLIGAFSDSLGDLIANFGLARVPYGALLLPWLLEGALAKINSFVRYMADKLNRRRASFVVADSGAADGDS